MCKPFSGRSTFVELSGKAPVKKEIELYVIEQVKRRRIKCGLSQAALADCLELSRGFIGDVENPRQPAKYNLNHLNQIARILECSPRDFLPVDPL